MQPLLFFGELLVQLKEFSLCLRIFEEELLEELFFELIVFFPGSLLDELPDQFRVTRVLPR